jgi:tetratricopeptide (TPR) repeat protein
VTDGGVLTRFSERVLVTWRKGLDRFAVYAPREGLDEEGDPERLFVRARALARAGDLNTAARLFARAAELAPTLGEAFEAHGEILDMAGQTESAAARYAAVRKLRAEIRGSAPDRTFVLRHRRRYTAEIAAYTSVLHSIRRHALPHIARGNAYLAEGRPEEALGDYRKALHWKPDLPDIKALIGEALSMMGQYEKALVSFDAALVARPRNPDILSGRAIARLALGRLEDADADWRRQLELLPPSNAAARACVALRLADYALALPELERALEKEPGDPYWQLYRLTALRRLDRPASPVDVSSSDAWPAPLLALHAGTFLEVDALKRAADPGQRAEALFQLGVLALSKNPDEARRRFRDVVETAPPSMIEYAAARHELARTDNAANPA